jgi:hypothetical protein
MNSLSTPLLARTPAPPVSQSRTTTHPGWSRGPTLGWDASTLLGRHAGSTVCFALMTSHSRGHSCSDSCSEHRHTMPFLFYLIPIPRLADPSTFPAPSRSPGLLAPSIHSLGPISHSSGPRHAAPYFSLSELTIFDTRRLVDLVIIPATTEILEIDHLPRLANCWEHKWETAQPNSFVGVPQWLSLQRARSSPHCPNCAYPRTAGARARPTLPWNRPPQTWASNASWLREQASKGSRGSRSSEA